MTKKFDALYNEVYVGLFNEEAPLPPDPDAGEGESPEQTAVPQDVPAPPEAGGQAAVPTEEPPIADDGTGSQLPDPKAQERVGIDALNAIISLFQKAPNEQKLVIDRLKEIAGSGEINDQNYKDALAALRMISPNSTI